MPQRGDPCPSALPGSWDPAGRHNSSKGITQHDHGVPADAQVYTAPDGKPFFAPPWADFKAAYDSGVLDGGNWLSQWDDFGYWGTYDFQRDGDTLHHAYIPAANYAVGIGLHGMGYSRQEALDHATLVKRWGSGNAGAPDAADWQARGWDAAESGACTRP